MQRDDDRTQSLQDWLTEINLSFDEPIETTWRTLAARLEEYGIHTILTPFFKGTVSTPIEIIVKYTFLNDLPIFKVISHLVFSLIFFYSLDEVFSIILYVLRITFRN